MKPNKFSLLLAIILAMTACSKSSNPLAGLEPSETPPATGEQPKEQDVPNNVPAIPDNAIYLGTKALVITEETTLVIDTKPGYAVYDLEYMATANDRFFFDKLYTSYQGECTQSETFFEWLKVNDQGEVLEEQVVGYFSYFDTEVNGRYLLRVHFDSFSDCDIINLGVKVVSTN